MIAYFIFFFSFISFPIRSMEQPEALMAPVTPKLLTFAEKIVDAKSDEEKIVLINSCDANKLDNGFTPLHALCVMGLFYDNKLRPHIMKLIERTRDINNCSASGMSALHAVFLNAKSDGDLEPLLRTGAVWDPKNNGTSPLRLLHGQSYLLPGNACRLFFRA